MALTLQQIISFADKYPNSESSADKCTYLDSLQRELYHRFEFPEQIEEMVTVAGQGVYVLPSYIIPSRIKSVVVTDSDNSDPKEYALIKNGSLPGYCYYTIGTSSPMIRIYPTPDTSGKLIIINFEDGPNTLSSSDLTTVPRLFKDFHFKIFVNALKAYFAELRNDVEMRNNFQSAYEEGLRDAEKHLNDHAPRPIIDNYNIGGDY